MGRRGGITVHMSFAKAIFDGLGVKPFLWGIDTLCTVIDASSTLRFFQIAFHSPTSTYKTSIPCPCSSSAFIDRL